MATTPVPAPEAQATISPLGRITGVLFSPKSTFEDIVRKPTWLPPMVLEVILAIVVCFCLNQRMNWLEYIGQQIDKNPRAAQMPSEQKQQQIETSAKYAPIATYVFGVGGQIVAALVVSLTMWG